MVEIVSLEDHLRKILFYTRWQLQLKLPHQSLKFAYVHLL